MSLRCTGRVLFLFSCLALPAALLQARTQEPSSSSSSKQKQKPTPPVDSAIDNGFVINGVYHNKSLALTCKIPEAWVLRTEEMNAREEEKNNSTGASSPPASSAGAKVLLATFSRPPAAKGEDVNSSIVIAAESVSSYPGLREAAQYFEPLAEVAKAQGFTQDEELYEVAVGAKTLVRADFHKNVGSRVMHQSTLAMLARGYAVSITLIAGTEDEVEGLIDGLSFPAPANPQKR